MDPTWIVQIVNKRTKAVTNVTPDAANGSFKAYVPASKADTLELVLTDGAGNVTRLPVPPFQGEDGSVVIGSEGGTVIGEGGVFAQIEPGSLPDGTVVKVEPITEGELPLPLPNNTTVTNTDTLTDSTFFMSFIGGVELNLGGATPGKYIDLGVPAPANASADDQVLVLQAITLTNGTQAWTLIDRAHLDPATNRYVTASPPFPGALSEATYAFLRPTNIIVPGPNGELDTFPVHTSDDVIQRRIIGGVERSIIAAGPDGILQTEQYAQYNDDVVEADCVSYVSMKVSLNVQLSLTSLMLPIAYPAYSRVTMAGYCNQPLEIQVMDPDTGSVIMSVSQKAPAGRNTIVTPPDIITDDSVPPTVVDTVLPTALYDSLQEVYVRFSEAMDVESAEQGLKVLDSNGNAVAGTVQVLFENRVVVFRPAVAFRLGEEYTVSVEGVRGLCGQRGGVGRSHHLHTGRAPLAGRDPQHADCRPDEALHGSGRSRKLHRGRAGHRRLWQRALYRQRHPIPGREAHRPATSQEAGGGGCAKSQRAQRCWAGAPPLCSRHAMWPCCPTSPFRTKMPRARISALRVICWWWWAAACTTLNPSWRSTT